MGETYGIKVFVEYDRPSYQVLSFRVPAEIEIDTHEFDDWVDSMLPDAIEGPAAWGLVETD